jgi:hypothetical protein
MMGPHICLRKQAQGSGAWHPGMLIWQKYDVLAGCLPACLPASIGWIANNNNCRYSY